MIVIASIGRVVMTLEQWWKRCNITITIEPDGDIWLPANRQEALNVLHSTVIDGQHRLTVWFDMIYNDFELMFNTG